MPELQPFNKPEEITTSGFHPDNPAAPPYDMDLLVKQCPSLFAFILSPDDRNTIDFALPEAVYQLNRAMLMAYFGIKHWDIPQDYLIPGVPMRAEYIYRMADFLLQNGIEKNVRAVDIGTGANLIYPIIGNKAFGWKFLASDVDPRSVEIASAIAKFNGMQKSVLVIQQSHSSRYFQNILKHGHEYTLSLCNPPFHASAAEAKEEALRKQQNLDYKNKQLNFGGTASELWVNGGERSFIERMIEESIAFAHQVRFFSSLVSKKENLSPLIQKLKSAKIARSWIINMDHGQKKSRILIWTFQNAEISQDKL